MISLENPCRDIGLGYFFPPAVSGSAPDELWGIFEQHPDSAHSRLNPGQYQREQRSTSDRYCERCCQARSLAKDPR